MALGVVLMSALSQKDTPDPLADFEPTAYKNFEIQDNPMYVLRTSAVSGEKVMRFQENAARSLGDNLKLAPTRSPKATFNSEKDRTAFFEQDLEKGKLSFNKGMSKYMEDSQPKL